MVMIFYDLVMEYMQLDGMNWIFDESPINIINLNGIIPNLSEC